MIPKFIAPEFVVAGIVVFLGIFLVPLALILMQHPALEHIDHNFWGKLGEGISNLSIFSS